MVMLMQQKRDTAMYCDKSTHESAFLNQENREPGVVFAVEQNTLS